MPHGSTPLPQEVLPPVYFRARFIEGLENRIFWGWDYRQHVNREEIAVEYIQKDSWFWTRKEFIRWLVHTIP